MTSLSKCHFASCAGIPRHGVAAGRAVSWLSDTFMGGNCRMQIGAAKGRAGWGDYCQLQRWFVTALLFLFWKAPTDFPASQEEAALLPCNWHWAFETTYQGSRHHLALPCFTDCWGCTEIRGLTGYKPGLPLKGHLLPLPNWAVWIQPLRKEQLGLALGLIWSKQRSKHPGLQEEGPAS